MHITQHGDPKMSMATATNSNATRLAPTLILINPNSYAARVNANRNTGTSYVVDVAQRWNDSINALPAANQGLAKHMLKQAIAEFRRRHPHIKSWADLDLVEAKEETLNNVKIDVSMQRQLNVFWVIELINNFSCTLVMPIQVYRDRTNDMATHAWDGQHTIVMLWIICTMILEEDPDKVVIPVNIYKSHLKAEMRNNFITLNSSEGKKHLDLIDHFVQQVLGVRIDGSKNPDWVASELKQRHAENNDLFYTSKKMGDSHMPGAISRMHEFVKLDPHVVDWLCRYLGLTTAGSRPATEKEVELMAKFFDMCDAQKIKVDDQYITELHAAMDHYWGADLDDEAQFWTDAAMAYYSWHSSMGFGVDARFHKNIPHGMPYLLAQLARGFAHKLPVYHGNSGFVPLPNDLR
jgi:hypothetical protein